MKIFICVLLRSVLLFALIRIFDVYLLTTRPLVPEFQMYGYFLASVFSLLLLSTLIYLQLFFRKKIWRQVYLALVAAVITAMVVCNYFIYGEFGEYLSPYMIRFMLASPDYLPAYLKNFLSPSIIFGFLLVVLCFSRLLRVDAAAGKTFSKSRVFAAVFAVLCLGPLLEEIRVKTPKSFKGLETQTFFAVWVVAKPSKLLKNQISYERHEVQGVQPPKVKLPNIVLVINESWGADKKNLLDNKNGPARMPRLAEYIAARPESTFVFETAFTNATATDISVPSILTGVHPDRPAAVRNSAPLVWQWAGAMHYETIFATSQTVQWANFSDFFQPRPDQFYSMDELLLPIANEFGGDDIEAIAKITQKMQGRDRTKPFFFVFFSNSLHAPYQVESKYLSFKKEPSRYDNALRINDEAISQLTSFLSNEGYLGETFMIMTADHGDSDELLHRQVPRVASFFDEIAKIPFLISIPDSWAEVYPERVKALRHNAQEMVGNVDIAATIIDILGLESDNRDLMSEISGHSLLAKVPAQRLHLCLSTNDTREWEPNGFGLYSGTERLVYSSVEGLQFFEVLQDQRQQKNIWPSKSEESRARFEAYIEGSINPKKMYAKWRARIN